VFCVFSIVGHIIVFAVLSQTYSGLLAWAVAATWLAGFTITFGATAAMGERNPQTYGDSLSGDDDLDLCLCVFWYIFWPCYLLCKVGKLLGRIA
jgi:hypothetical protein